MLSAAVFIVLLIVRRRNGLSISPMVVVPARKAANLLIQPKSVLPVQYIPLFRLYENGQNWLK
jgi:hypothetical protein